MNITILSHCAKDTVPRAEHGQVITLTLGHFFFLYSSSSLFDVAVAVGDGGYSLGVGRCQL